MSAHRDDVIGSELLPQWREELLRIPARCGTAVEYDLSFRTRVPGTFEAGSLVRARRSRWKLEVQIISDLIPEGVD
ncbi:MAG: hypothetical protein AB7G93_08365 [Bdellovibrionales bacterium]